jgi:c-di-GMP-binding flagellar brake protein YcgR
MSVPAPRFDIELPVELTSSDADSPISGASVNISETGMLVLAREARPRGSSVRFQFHAFGGEGEVIWSRDDAGGGVLLGLRFVSLARQDRRTLQRILESPTFLGVRSPGSIQS